MKKVYLLLILLTSLGSLSAQDEIKFDFTFNHLALSVQDLDASVLFYKKVFQFTEIDNRSKIEGIRWLSLSEGKELHLISIIKEKVIANKALHLAFATSHFDEFVTHLEKMKISYSDWPGAVQAITKRPDGVKQLYFQDPDGYWIEINNGYAAAPDEEKIKNEIWGLEENYWKYVKAKDLKSYLTLWDEKFIGYPADNIIGDKSHITDWIAGLYKDPGRNFNYELIRKVENVFGDIVIVLYDVKYTWINANKEILATRLTKITHTWKKTDQGWLIIGGMGATKS